MGRGLDGYFVLVPVLARLCGFEGPREARSLQVSGGFGVGETPLPIPNRAVKPHSADGTWPSRAWESRSPPVSSSRAAPPGGSFALWRALPLGAARTGAREGCVRGASRTAAPRGICARRVSNGGTERGA